MGKLFVFLRSPTAYAVRRLLSATCQHVYRAPGHQETGCARGGRRRALATRWLGDDARFCLKPGEVAIPTFETGLSHGDRMAGEHFPRII